MHVAAMRSGRAAAERMMTSQWIIYRDGGEAFNDETGQYEPVTTTVYVGPGKLQSFESYERNAVSVGAPLTMMRPHLHLPVNDETAMVDVDDYAVCTASPTNPGQPGTTVRIAGVLDKDYQTARRFPVEEVL